MIILSHDKIAQGIDELYRTKQFAEQYPQTFKAIHTAEKKKERILPRSLRHAYRSNNKGHIESEISDAMKKGFTKQEIQLDFARWRQRQKMKRSQDNA